MFAGPVAAALPKICSFMSTKFSPGSGVGMVITAGSMPWRVPTGKISRASTVGTAFYASRKGAINKVTPSTIVYWLKLNLAAGAHHVEIDQAITSGNFSQKFTLGSGSKVLTPACANVKNPAIAAGPNGSVTVDFNAASAGTYYVAVRYLVSAVNGKTEPNPTTVHYELSTAGVAGSTSGIDLKKTATAAPARSVRATFLRALRH